VQQRDRSLPDGANEKGPPFRAALSLGVAEVLFAVLAERSEDDQQVTHSRCSVSVDVGRAAARSGELTGPVLRRSGSIVVVGIRVRATE